jgi:hypothetical protein
VSEQLALDVTEPRTFTCCGAPCPNDRQSRPSDHAPDCSNPNLWMFDAEGNPRRLLWCSDSARLGGPCPYVDGEAPAGGCCKELAA